MSRDSPIDARYQKLRLATATPIHVAGLHARHNPVVRYSSRNQYGLHHGAVGWILRSVLATGPVRVISDLGSVFLSVEAQYGQAHHRCEQLFYGHVST
jgi:hypothetical protein